MKKQQVEHEEYFTNYDPKLDQKHVRVVERKKATKDVNPLLKINYDGKNFSDSRPIQNIVLTPLREGEKRARFLFVLMDQNDHLPKWTFGPAYLAAALEAQDYEVRVFDGNALHWGVDRLAKFLSEEPFFDYIGFGFLSNYVHLLIEHVKVCRAVTPNSKVILGANGFSPLPAFYLAKTGADYGVSGEAEVSLINLVNTLQAGKSPEHLPSTSFRDGKDIFVSDLREPVPEITSIAWPAYHHFHIEKYIHYRSHGYKKGSIGFHILTSRGCPYRCNFCTRMEEGIRFRPFDDLFGELEFLNGKYGVTHFLHLDELFMTSKKHVKNFCEATIKAMDDGSLPRITWATTGRFNIVDKEIAEVMAAAGCNEILFGLESGDTKVLELMNKKTSEELIGEGINATKNAGMSVQLPCMFGNIGETPETVRKTVEVLIKYAPREHRTVRPVTPYPGSPLYQYALDQGLIRDHEEFFQMSRNPDQMTVNFTDMDDQLYHETLFEANKTLVESYYEEASKSEIEGYRRLYFDGDDSSFEPPDHQQS